MIVVPFLSNQPTVTCIRRVDFAIQVGGAREGQLFVDNLISEFFEKISYLSIWIYGQDFQTLCGIRCLTLNYSN